MTSKRKRHYRPSSGSDKQRPSHHQASSQHSPKRRRLSSDTEDTFEGTRNIENGRSHGERDQQDNDGWTMVERKASKSRKDEQQAKSDYPQIRYHQNYQAAIRLADLRDLGLYLLADEVAPRWVGIANSRYVKKVVMILVAGLDEKLLLKAKRRLSRQKSGADLHEQSAPDDSRISSQNAMDDPSDRGTNPIPNVSCSWMFKNLIDVKAPGDAKINRVHSPLQAMLLVPEQQQKKSTNPYQDRSFTAVPTPITEFVHSSDELRDANFPIHPASFTNDTDAKLEQTRREQTGQGKNAGWVDTDVKTSKVMTQKIDDDRIAAGTSIYSIDCEMVQTSDGVNSLARVSMISYPNGKVVIDKYVKPSLPITNYFTQYSGITPEILQDVTTTLEDVQKDLLQILTLSSILMGHSLDSDLNALKLTHPFLVDTSLIYPHPRGLPLRSSLKYLANKYLKREIQSGGANGHNSVEDAQAVLDLVKLKCKNGPKYGTMEANGESIFKRLKRSGRTSAMIEYGTPERGFGKDATYTIGCQDDDDIVKGVARAVKGDNFFDFEIPAGGSDFVWGRLRALEYARGWVGGASNPHQQDAASATDSARQDKADSWSTAKEHDDQEHEEQLISLACETLDRVQQIHDSLPEKSFLIVFSGTSDVRPVMRLQAQQQQYRKEFKIKKWDELTIKWTDTEEQALKKACEDARAGWGVCTIK